VPFLFKSDNNQCLAQVNDQVNNRSQLELTLTPKTAQDLNLSGYALRMFPFANQALATDNDLGAAVINAGLPVNGVPLTTEEGDALYQKIYSQFAPNVTGASRALAVALTDQATGPVAERQRELRMYAAQPGDLTIWGQEFAVSLNQDANAGTIGYRDSGFGFAVGADGGDPVDGRYGGALTFYSGDIAEKQPRTENACCCCRFRSPTGPSKISAAHPKASAMLYLAPAGRRPGSSLPPEARSLRRCSVSMAWRCGRTATTKPGVVRDLDWMCSRHTISRCAPSWVRICGRTLISATSICSRRPALGTDTIS